MGKDAGPTALKFLDTDNYATAYQNDMFLGDVNNGYLYRFELNNTRTGLILDGLSNDKQVESSDGLTKQIIFGEGFGTITDIQVGPDGYMYILTHDKSEGAIYRIVSQ
jgi:aldose sugar dehydrogenase